MTTPEAIAIAVTVEARIAVLWRQRQRDRRQATWTPARHDRETELRALLAVRRTGRRLARQAVERPTVLLEVIDHPADATWTV
jgi:hypothetical protein